MALKIFNTMQKRNVGTYISKRSSWFIFKFTVYCFLHSGFDYTFESFQYLELNSDYYFITNNDSSEFESVEAPKLEIICLEPMSQH